MTKKILVTGGCGFIGSNFIGLIHDTTDWDIVNVDCKTYAGKGRNLEHMGIAFSRNASGVACPGSPRYEHYWVDVVDRNLPVLGRDPMRNPRTIAEVVRKESPDYVVHFAAESHVDQSLGARGYDCWTTNIFGTLNVMDACLDENDEPLVEKVIHISTDEVYGELPLDSTVKSVETDRLLGTSPYAASKAAAEQVVRGFYCKGLPVVVTRSVNNIGPYQHPEKFIPRSLTNLLSGDNIMLMGKGENIRSWVYVNDKCRIVKRLLEHGKPGKAYNIGVDVEKTNREAADGMLGLLGFGPERITLIKDRKTHDLKYAVNTEELMDVLPEFNFEFETFGDMLYAASEWYGNNEPWWRPLKDE